MSDYRVEVKIKNNRIFRFMNELGFDSALAFTKAYPEISYPSLINYLSMKKSPIAKDRSWKETALKLCEVFNCHPTDLFTDAQQQAIKSNSRFIELNEKEMMSLVDKSDPEQQALGDNFKQLIAESLDMLTPRERKVVNMRFGLPPYQGKTHTFKSIADEFGVTNARIQQLEAKALRKLRGREISDLLKEAGGLS